ncbi:MAG TPA: BadF/BadG/BcrA/BcrD ATPase family protein, partial [Candidatus Methylomirabilis sp.]|nr:BadF/BadG/BcrA/BcrD ATPase family protein [Candidatus Methylomirabilis sp.]
MAISVGIDIGAISVKAAVLGTAGDRPVLESLALTPDFAWLSFPDPILVSSPCRALGDPLGVAEALLASVLRQIAGLPPGHVGATGCGAGLLQARRGIPRVNDAKAIAMAMGLLHPEVATVFEMGGQSSRFLQLKSNGSTRQARLQDYETNGDCAAGTGAFMDQQATRLRYQVEEIGRIACAAPSAARIAGRCSVFAKSDMIHAQQKGADPPQILRGLCDAVARNFKGSITKGKPAVPPVAFIGGLA